MKLYLIFNKKNLAIITGVIIISLIVLSRFASVDIAFLDGSTNAKRISYLSGLGYDVDDSDCTSKNTLIPEEFSDVYEQYNNVQAESGFDLSKYKGKTVTVYTYPVNDSDMYVNLIVCNGEIIGGDVSSHAIGGSMQPLLKIKE